MSLRFQNLARLRAVVGACALTGALVVSLAICESRAHAQDDPPTVSTDGTLSNPAAGPEPAAPPPPPPGPVIIPIGPDGKPVQLPEKEDPSVFYFRDGKRSPAGSSIRVGGPVPESHVVRRGDTLWDITWFYFNNPFDWPKVWSYNPQISNPHWIYPGDQVRLYEEGQGPVVVNPTDPDVDVDQGGDQPQPQQSRSFDIRQLAFVDTEKLKFAGKIDGSTDEKILLSTGDSVYLSYRKDKRGRPKIKVGDRFAIYKPRKPVKHPDGGKQVGAFVRVIGELEVVSVKKDRRARAIITDSTDVIERGARYGPLKRTFRDIKPTENKVDLQGVIVEQLVADELIGARQVVFIDKGKNDKVKVGNRLFVVRRGDAYVDYGGRVDNTGLDDRRFPARSIGEIIVVQTDKTTSVALVTLSLQEIGIGDKVVMRRPKKK